MDDAVDGEDVSLLYANGTIVVDIDTVRIFAGLPYGELLVVEACEDELILVGGEVCRIIECSEVVSTVDDAVVNDDLTYGVSLVLAGEGIPRSLGDEAFFYQVLQICLYGIIVRSKDSIDTTCTEQLAYLRVAELADVYLFQDINIAAIGLVLL
jgi:hypothetical protein